MGFDVEMVFYITRMASAIKGNFERDFAMDMVFLNSITYKYTMGIGTTIKYKDKEKYETVQ